MSSLWIKNPSRLKCVEEYIKTRAVVFGKISLANFPGSHVGLPRGQSLKDIETKYGVDANYWHIAEINIFWKTMRANVILDGYPDYQSRINLKQILARKEFNIDISDLTQIPVKNVLEIASSIYQLVKYYVQDFEYAENVIEEGQEIIDISPYLPVKAHIIPTKPIQDPNSIPYYPPAVILNRTEVSMLSAVVTVNSK